MKKGLFLALILILAVTFVSEAEELKMICGPKGSDIWELSNHITSALTRARKNSNRSIADVRLVSSSGPYESIRRLFSRDSDVAVVDALTAYEASRGLGGFSDLVRRDVLALAVLGLEVDHFVLVSSKAANNDISDFNEKMLYLGKRGDYRRHGAFVSLKSCGIETVFEGGSEWDYDTSTELMIDGSIDGAVYIGIPPVKAVSDLRKVMGNALVIFTIDEAKILEMREFFPVWFSHTIPARTYARQNEPIITVARPILLVATKSLDKKRAEGLVSSIFDGECAGHLTSVGHPVSLEMSRKYRVIEYHPGVREFVNGAER
jgi:TRAP transporter TAXI family solute receptor